MLKIQKTIFAFVIVSTIFSSPLSALAAGDPSSSVMDKTFLRADEYLQRANTALNTAVIPEYTVIGDTDGDGVVDGWEVPLKYDQKEVERYPDLIPNTKRNEKLFDAYLQLTNHYTNATNFQASIVESQGEIKNYLKGVKTLKNQLSIAAEQAKLRNNGRLIVAGGTIVSMVIPTGLIKLAVQKVLFKTIIRSISSEALVAMKGLGSSVVGENISILKKSNIFVKTSTDKMLKFPGVYRDPNLYLTQSNYKSLREWQGISLTKYVKITEKDVINFDKVQELKRIIRLGAYEPLVPLMGRAAIAAGVSEVVNQADPSKTDVVLEALGIEMGRFTDEAAAYYELIKNSFINIKMLSTQVDSLVAKRDAEVAAFSKTLVEIKNLEKLQKPAELNPMGNN